MMKKVIVSNEGGICPGCSESTLPGIATEKGSLAKQAASLGMDLQNRFID